MKDLEVVVGVDVGTTGAKTVVLDTAGAVVATGAAAYEMDVPRPGWAEQDPEIWWDGVRTSFHDALRLGGVERDRVKGAGFTGQMHGSVFLDASGTSIRPALLWCDQRTAREVAEIEDRLGGAQGVLRAAGNPALTGFTAPKILWLRKQEPDAYQSLRHLLLPKDYVVYRATGERSADVTDASGTLLLDVEGRDWSPRILTALDIDSSLLAPIHESHDVVGSFTATAAEALGLKAGIPVVAGAGDQAAGGVGTAAIAPGRISLSVGTSGVVFTATDSYRLHPSGSLHSFCHALPKTWHLMGVTLAAGGSMRWATDLLTGSDFERGSSLASEAPAGGDGLVFLPYLSGERTPHADPDARGVFFGLSYVHDARHMLRAVMEGVAFSLADCFSLFRDMDVQDHEVVISGGGAHSEVWRRIIASAINRPVTALEPEEGPATGAAILAGVGAGIWKDVSTGVSAVLQPGVTTEPVPEWTALYEGVQETYRDVYRSTRNLFPRLG